MNTMTPEQAADTYLELARIDEQSAMAFAIRYEESICQTEEDFDTYLTLIDAGY